MLFNSIHFLLFGPICILIYFSLPLRYRTVWLFAISLYFYAIFKVVYLSLLIFCFLGTKFFVDRMVDAKTNASKLTYLNIAVLGNLSLLFLFKYLDFFIKVINEISGHSFCEPESLPAVGIILPMGISFFTLQAISYAVDVYRGTVPKAESYFQFGLFISFFPQLVAGPIIRAGDMLHQFLVPTEYKRENLILGLRQILAGFFKKTFVADPISVLIDPIYARPDDYSGFAMWLAAFLFSVQVYCDFAGYSDVAIGLGRILGFQIPVNFQRPFLSGTITELWRRWHISFSSWLRDYVYISLGGSRVSTLRVYLNLFITTFVSGIWHGADWTYVLWGAIHASMMVFEKLIFQFAWTKQKWNKVPRLIQVFYPFGIFIIAAILFRSRDTLDRSGLENAFFMLKSAFFGKTGIIPEIPIPVVLAIFLLFASEIWQEFYQSTWEKLWNNEKLVILLTVCMYIVCFAIYSVSASQQFIYFQF